MNDRYSELVQSGIGKKIAKNLGLPTPAPLERHKDGNPLLTGEVLARFSDDVQKATPAPSALRDAILAFLSRHRAITTTDAFSIAHAQGFDGVLFDMTQKLGDTGSRFKVVLFDASDIVTLQDLDKLYRFFHQVSKKIKASGRIVILAKDTTGVFEPQAQIASRAILGFAKSLAKEVKGGITVNVIYIKEGLEHAIDSTLGFFASAKSAYVSGQAVHLNHPTPHFSASVNAPLTGRNIVVTGASRGIGAAIAEKLSAEGAYVVGVDLPTGLGSLQKNMGNIGAKALALDITDSDAGTRLLDAVGTLDGIVHNAGITQDKTLAKMSITQWQAVISVNLASVYRITEYLLNNNGLSDNGRITCVSSIAGIAGNFGQTNYATSKAGIIGLTRAIAPTLAGTGRTINAVAPGFIETAMTAKIPFAIREAGRRMNALSIGGLPIDVAEAIAWLQDPATGAVNGETLRVCGLSLLGE